MADLMILRLADALARHAAGRHDLTARNIANADTAGYKATDLAPFEAELADRFGPRATRPTHLHGAGRARWEQVESTAAGAAGPNGNDVSLSDQLARAAEAQGDHDRALAVWGKTLGILRAGLGRR